MKACIFFRPILVNCSPTKDFKIHKELRQGDPLAPFIFLIVVEGLVRMVKKIVQIGSFERFKVFNNQQYSLLQFVDDTILIGKGNWENLWSIKTIFRSFELVSVLRVNFSKSNLIGFNLKEDFMNADSIFISCITSLPFRFLGIPIGANPRRRSTCQSKKKYLEACERYDAKKTFVIEWSSLVY